MGQHHSPLEVLDLAFKQARLHDWRGTQEICASIAEQPPPVGAVARLDILICQYHLGHTQQIPERALPLLSHLPASAHLACVGLSLLAARKNASLPVFKPVVLALAAPANLAFDLPTVPLFVLLHPDLATCSVAETADASLMSEVVQTYLDSDALSEEERSKLESLAHRYRERAATIAASDLAVSGGEPRRKPWWKF